MPIKATPSWDYPFVLVSEDWPAHRDHASAIRALKKKWAAEEKAERVGYFIARVETYVEPDYEFQTCETPVCPPCPPPVCEPCPPPVCQPCPPPEPPDELEPPDEVGGDEAAAVKKAPVEEAATAKGSGRSRA
jgi:hypothetical protein